MLDSLRSILVTAELCLRRDSWLEEPCGDATASFAATGALQESIADYREQSRAEQSREASRTLDAVR